MNLDDPRLEVLRRYTEGQATRDDLAQLEHALTEDAAFRRFVVEYLHVDCALEVLAAAEAPAATGMIAPWSSRARSRRRYLWGGLAAALAIGAAGWLFRPRPSGAPAVEPLAAVTAEVLEVVDAQIRQPGSGLRVGERAQLTALQLAAGRIALR
ncbi:MAG: hypothetical protein FJ399_15550, partial [Verrucomicrobia bacterium]|nr:hypothetical protein [Verrucomicrobiota bacterium]